MNPPILTITCIGNDVIEHKTIWVSEGHARKWYAIPTFIKT